MICFRSTGMKLIEQEKVSALAQIWEWSQETKRRLENILV
jgi:hypothetical protein